MSLIKYFGRFAGLTSLLPSEQVEQLLSTKGQDAATPQVISDKAPGLRVTFDQTATQSSATVTGYLAVNPQNDTSDGMGDPVDWQFNQDPTPNGPVDDLGFAASMGLDTNGMENNSTWEMIGLGLDEPLPPQELIDELCVYQCFPTIYRRSTNCSPLSHQIYFEKIHPSLPMIHKYRYLAAMNL